MLASCAGSRGARLPAIDAHDRVAADIDGFVGFALEPAKVAPPTVAWVERRLEVGPLVARVAPLRPEDAAWNRWHDGSARLFNNRMAHLFLVRIEGPGPLEWVPRESALELNDEGLRLRPAPRADIVLRELTFWALMQQRWQVPGDLASRTRSAGPFRAAYLPLLTEGDVLEGVVAFELLDPALPDGGIGVADIHVVALRLTLSVRAGGQPHTLVWTFD